MGLQLLFTTPIRLYAASDGLFWQILLVVGKKEVVVNVLSFPLWDG